MRPISALLLLAAALPAADDGSWDYWVRVQATGGMPALGGDLAYGINGNTGTTFSASDVGLDSREITPGVEIGIGVPIFDFGVHLGWTKFSTEGDGRISQNLTFGSQPFTAGTTVTGSLDLTDAYAEAYWAPIALDLAGFSVGVAVHQLAVDASLAASGVTSSVSTSAQLPMLAVRAYASPLDMLEAEVRIHALSVPVGPASGTFIDAQAQLAFYPLANLGVTGGWRHTQVDVEIEDGSSTLTAAVNLSGPYLGIAAQF